MLSAPVRLFLFFALSALVAWISRKPLKNKTSHGFYRFFAFEGILFLMLYNEPVWFDDPLSPRQCLSWTAFLLSLYLVFAGTGQLRHRGGQKARASQPENFAFENTCRLVTSGIYRFIRHPMYASLLFLAWGSFLKQITPVTLAAVTMVTFSLVCTARAEERENIAFFGAQYKAYMGISKRFLPFVF